MVHINMGFYGEYDDYYSSDSVSIPGVISASTFAALTNLHPSLNLTTYKPPEWSDLIVISKTQGIYSDSSPLNEGDTLYLSWAVINNGKADITFPFSVAFYVDGNEINRWSEDSLEVGYYTHVKDFKLSPLSVGTHSIKLVADVTGLVPESSELDNEYMKAITIQGNSTSMPNLRPYQPSGWSDKMVVSTVTGTHTDSAQITPTDNIHVDCAVLNDGKAATSSSFYIKILLDGVEMLSGHDDPPFQSNYYTYWEDGSLGSLSSGTRTIKIVIDSANTITESNEYDNEYTKTIFVQGGSTSLPNLTPYQPPGWSAPIVVSDVRGTHTDSSSFHCSPRNSGRCELSLEGCWKPRRLRRRGCCQCSGEKAPR